MGRHENCVCWSGGAYMHAVQHAKLSSNAEQCRKKENPPLYELLLPCMQSSNKNSPPVNLEKVCLWTMRLENPRENNDICNNWEQQPHWNISCFIFITWCHMEYLKSLERTVQNIEQAAMVARRAPHQGLILCALLVISTHWVRQCSTTLCPSVVSAYFITHGSQRQAYTVDVSEFN